MNHCNKPAERLGWTAAWRDVGCVGERRKTKKKKTEKEVKREEKQQQQ